LGVWECHNSQRFASQQSDRDRLYDIIEVAVEIRGRLGGPYRLEPPRDGRGRRLAVGLVQNHTRGPGSSAWDAALVLDDAPRGAPHGWTPLKYGRRLEGAGNNLISG